MAKREEKDIMDNYIKHLIYAIKHKNIKEQERILRDLYVLGGMSRNSVARLLADFGFKLLNRIFIKGDMIKL